MSKRSVSGRIARAAGRQIVKSASKRHPDYCPKSRNDRHHFKSHKVGGFPVTYCGDCGRVK